MKYKSLKAAAVAILVVPATILFALPASAATTQNAFSAPATVNSGSSFNLVANVGANPGMTVNDLKFCTRNSSNTIVAYTAPNGDDLIPSSGVTIRQNGITLPDGTYTSVPCYRVGTSGSYTPIGNTKTIVVGTSTPSPSPTPTVTPTPSPTPSGTPTSPSTYPDASNTGVPVGTALIKVPADITSGPGWDFRGGGEQCIHVDTAGAVLSGLDVTGCIEVYANNVTIQNTRVTAAGDGWAIGARGVSGLTVKDAYLSGGGLRMAVGVKDVTGSSDVTVLRTNVSGYSSGIQLSRGLIQDSYVHDPILQAGDHTNGFTDNGGRTDGSMVLRHNTILNTFDQADAISFFQDFGVIKNVTADNNLIAGGSYAMYAGGGSKGTSSNVTITNNKFSTRYFSGSGTFGPVTAYDNVATNTFSGNVWYDGPKAGQTISAP